MLKQLWASGIIMAFSVFGIKAGLGLGALMAHRHLTSWRKALFLAATLFIYLLLFAGMHFIVARFNLLVWLDRFIQMLRYGMCLHLAVAAGLLAWGVALVLDQQGKGHRHGVGAGLFMVIPCPVCATVILLNLTLAYALFPLSPAQATGLLFGLLCRPLMAISAAVVSLLQSRIDAPDAFLGLAMILTALYFFLTVIIAPIYPELASAFAMSVSNNPINRIDPVPTLILAGTVLALGTGGFLRTYSSGGTKK